VTARQRPTPLLDRPGFLLSQLGFYSAGSFTEQLSELGLHPRHFGMLIHLATGEGRSQQQLADSMSIHRNVMVGLVDELEQRGLVERRRHPEDRRAYALHLTPDARMLLPRAERIADRHDRNMCAPLDDDDRETLVALLNRLAEHAGLSAGVHPGLQE
jgi:DNA-binding MarR family transcriptional regulator